MKNPKSISLTSAEPPVKEVCEQSHSHCSDNSSCCEGLECRIAGPRRKALCLPQCAEDGDECFFGHECCEGLRCRFSPDSGSTRCQPSCSKPGDLCFDEECCPGFQCKENICTKCAMDGGRCGDGVECCDSTSWCAFSEEKGYDKCHFQ